MSFDALNLSAPLLRAAQACGFTAPTDIQNQAIPVLLEGRDLMASAQTGTGKTAAFVLPALQRLGNPPSARGNGPRVLILAPTRELATQVEQNIRDLGRFIRLASATVVGGVPYGPQIRALGRPLDILVATPGRLMDHMEQRRVDFGRLEMLVLDEADRMLNMGFVEAVSAIAAATPPSRQTVLFSATLEGEVLTVAKKMMRAPERLHLAAAATPHTHITQRAHRADDHRHKHALLERIISDETVSQAVIFTATKAGAESLAHALSDQGHCCAALHGDMNQGQRRRTVERMRRGKVRLLVATDVAARGLDISGITHVINFDLPMAAEDYVHRIGRTGRGGASGTAISLIGHQDHIRLQRIQRLTGRILEEEVLAGLEPRKPAPKQRPGGKPRSGKPGGFRKNAAPAHRHSKRPPRRESSFR